MKRLDREDPARNKKAERARGFTPPMPFCECGVPRSKDGATYHHLSCPVVGPHPSQQPAWFLGTGWAGCTCDKKTEMKRALHMHGCPVRTSPPANLTKPVVGNISFGMPYGTTSGSSSTPKITPDPYAEFAEFVAESIKWKVTKIAGMTHGEWQGCTCPCVDHIDPDEHTIDCPVFKKHVPKP